jgi:hypothetical protein
MDEKARATWVQSLEIVESKMSDDVVRDDKGNEYSCLVAELLFQVPSDALRPKTGEVDPNAGKQTRQWYRIVPAAQKNKQHPKYKANNFNIGRLNGIVRGIWGAEVFPHGAKVNLGEFFSGDAPAVVGQKVVALVQQSRYNAKLKDELQDFIPPELQGA